MAAVASSLPPDFGLPFEALLDPNLHFSDMGLPQQDSQETFSCSVCQKNFEKRTSRDRHVRRCRRKKPEDMVPRRKACSHCAASKARCDLKRPSCSRCQTKSLGCQYAHNASLPSPPEETPLEDDHPPEPARHTGMHSFADPMMMGNIDLNAVSSPGDLFAPGWPMLSFDNPGISPPSSNDESMDCELDCPSTPNILNIPNDMPSLTPSISLDSPPDTDPSTPHCPSMDLVHAGFGPDDPIECQEMMEQWRAQEQNRSTTCIQPRNPADPQSELVARLISTFPAMLKRPAYPPPFIHNSQLVAGKRGESLANALALVHLWTVRTDENRRFVASMLAMEWERLVKAIESDRLEERARLEAVQALVVYSILRYFDRNPVDGVKFSLAHCQTLEHCAMKLGLSGMMVRAEVDGQVPDWNQWVLAETKRRTMSALFTFDRLFHIQAGLRPFDCDGLGKMPLPCVRSVWEAPTKAAWEERYVAIRTDLAPFTSVENGSMLTLQDLWDGSEGMSVWYAEMDALGSAIMADSVIRLHKRGNTSQFAVTP